MEKVNKWKELVNTLTVEEKELMQAEMYEGLQLAKKESIKARGRLATRPKVPLNTVRKDRERELISILQSQTETATERNIDLGLRKEETIQKVRKTVTGWMNIMNEK